MSRARRGHHFLTNAVPFFAFMVGGSYGISVLLQVRDRKAWTRVFPASRMPTSALTTPNTIEPPARIPPEQGRNDVRDAKARALYARDLVLVRPDGHVAWRGDAAPDDALTVVDRVRGA